MKPDRSICPDCNGPKEARLIRCAECKQRMQAAQRQKKVGDIAAVAAEHSSHRPECICSPAAMHPLVRAMLEADPMAKVEAILNGVLSLPAGIIAGMGENGHKLLAAAYKIAQVEVGEEG